MDTHFFLNKTRILKLALAGAIVIVLNLFFIFSLQAVYERPTYENFCGNEQVKIIPQSQEECLAIGGQWIQGVFVQKGLTRPGVLEPPIIEEEQKGSCNADFTCSKEFSDSWGIYQRNVFIILVVLGALTLFASFIVRTVAVVGEALAFGGVFTLLIATTWYWPLMDDYVRVLVLGFVLVALLWVSFKQFKKNEEI